MEKKKLRLSDIVRDKKAVYAEIEQGGQTPNGIELEKGGVIIASRNKDEIILLAKLLRDQLSYTLVSEFTEPTHKNYKHEIAHSSRVENPGGRANSEHWRVTVTHEEPEKIELLKRALAGSKISIQKLEKDLKKPDETKAAIETGAKSEPSRLPATQEKEVSGSFWKWAKRVALGVATVGLLGFLKCDGTPETPPAAVDAVAARGQKIEQKSQDTFRNAIENDPDLTDGARRKMMEEFPELLKKASTQNAMSPERYLYRELANRGGLNHIQMLGKGKNHDEVIKNTGCMYAKTIAHADKMFDESKAMLGATGGGGR